MKKITYLFTLWASLIFMSADGQTKPTIIFVHGLWADDSSWSKAITLLVASGYAVISVQHPTTSLSQTHPCSG